MEKGLLEYRSQKSEVRSRKAEGRRQKAEVRKIREAYNKTILNSGYSKSTSTKMVVEPKKKGCPKISGHPF